LCVNHIQHILLNYFSLFSTFITCVVTIIAMSEQPIAHPLYFNLTMYLLHVSSLEGPTPGS